MADTATKNAYDMVAQIKSEIKTLEAQLNKLGTPVFIQSEAAKPEIMPSYFRKRVPLVAGNVEELLDVLELRDVSKPEQFAGVMAFIARNPGQARKLQDSWWDAFADYGVLPSREQVLTVIRIGELVANHKYVKTPVPHKKLEMSSFLAGAHPLSDTGKYDEAVLKSTS